MQNRLDEVEAPSVAWSSDSKTYQVPIVDVTDPRFAIEEDATSTASLQEKYVAEEQRFANTSKFVATAMTKLAAAQSRLLHGLVNTEEDFLDGLTTYLLKVGADNLPPGLDSQVDRNVAASGAAIAMRLRLQHCATLLAEGLIEPLQATPGKPLQLINIAGGTAIDTLNALIVLRKTRPELLQRELCILVLDQDTEGPAFGASATTALTREGQPLAGLAIEFRHETYDWNNTQSLADRMKQIAAEAIVGASSEGGLFEYGSDAAIIANLKALRGASAVVGSVTCDDPMRRASIARARFKLIPRGLETFGALARQGGFKVVRSLHTPLSDQVLMRASSASDPASVIRDLR